MSNGSGVHIDKFFDRTHSHGIVFTCTYKVTNNQRSKSWPLNSSYSKLFEQVSSNF